MSGAIFAAVSAIPWSKVVESLPGAIDQAQKLVGSLRKGKGGPSELPKHDGEPLNPVELIAVERERITALQAEVSRASELVLRLSETQAHLVDRIERLKRWLTGVCALAAVALLTTIALAILRR